MSDQHKGLMEAVKEPKKPHGNQKKTTRDAAVPTEGLTQERPLEPDDDAVPTEGVTQEIPIETEGVQMERIQKADKQLEMEKIPPTNDVDDNAVQIEGVTQDTPMDTQIVPNHSNCPKPVSHATLLKQVKKEKLEHIRKSERIVKKKLSRNIIGVNGEGNSSSKPVSLE
ncbi:hypothetical protein L2E82_35793 [Cichorium intybus]|uniref:Uncharacterized protein n=1 Tax=Cichorium intybus TaxID=13427 RepID=A0ACB9BQ46_CICIN|nr:hypothetical protein L2E82_35793 [Cichorium intybus]